MSSESNVAPPAQAQSSGYTPAGYTAARKRHWDDVARRSPEPSCFGRHYHALVQRIYRFVIPRGERVLEVGCGNGDLLAAVAPSHGVGIDLSDEMLKLARLRHPELTFVQGDAQDLPVRERFDYIILSDLVNDLENVQQALECLRAVSTPRTRVVLNFYSHMWEGPLRWAGRAGLQRRALPQNWLTVEDMQNLLYLAGFECIRTWPELLCPAPLPLLSAFLNRVLARLWPFRMLALTNIMLARLRPTGAAAPAVVSVIVPARNEAGNVPQIFARVPEMGRGTELIFVEGHSRDETYQAIEAHLAQNPQRRCRLLRQPGVGKGDAVRAGMEVATGEVLMILDADLTVAPEDLPRFYAALQEGKGEMINGVRLVYPMEDRAMRFMNLLGNKFFTFAFTWLMGQPIKDTLCGTKVLWAEDYRRIAHNRGYFGELDPFGDYDLLFGAAKLGLKIVDLPIRYRERVYGTTQIHRWRHGWLLLRMVALAARRLKFV
ncbi:MAG: glycosyltransferase [Lentisphaerae bacterium]|nr:glycosyltransferase [Lentisphaerota bacterium]